MSSRNRALNHPMDEGPGCRGRGPKIDGDRHARCGRLGVCIIVGSSRVPPLEDRPWPNTRSMPSVPCWVRSRGRWGGRNGASGSMRSVRCGRWPPMCKLEDVDCDGVRGEWSLASGSDASRVLMFFHGGGYCSGSIVSHRRMVTEAGRAARMRTLAIGYRLAPEHPYPAAHQDALTAGASCAARACRPITSRSVAIVRAAISRSR